MAFCTQAPDGYGSLLAVQPSKQSPFIHRSDCLCGTYWVCYIFTKPPHTVCRQCGAVLFGKSTITMAYPPVMKNQYSSRDLAYGGVFGASALLLPLLFHLVRLGPVFMPMYIPLVAMAFFVQPGVAIVTAMLVPFVSAALTGMPPLYPPIAPLVSVELGLIAGCIAYVRQTWPHLNEWILLTPVLLFGRLVFAGLAYLVAVTLHLPARFLAGVSVVAAWPGLLLMILVIPPFVRSFRRTQPPATPYSSRITH